MADLYVAFLRGMNLGRRRIKNEDLRAHVEALGFAEVSTFLASGNVIFEADLGDVEAIARRIESGLEKALDYAVPTFVRTAADVRRIAAHDPFPGASGGKPQVALLATAPSAPVQAEVEGFATAEDRIAVDGSELYWLPAGNLTDSELDLRTIGSLLGPMTIRTKRTLERIAAKYLAT